MDFNKKYFIFDGGMGTILQENGLLAGEIPELFNIHSPEIVSNIHKMYIESGADIITTNTFGANSFKIEKDLETIIESAVKNAKNAIKKTGKNVKIAFDVGPLGQLLEPVGTLSFNDAYNEFSNIIKIGANSGADVILIETMSDIYEAKAAICAAKDVCNLPVFCTMTFDENMRTLTGSDVKTVVSVLEGLNVDGLGLNCGRGPIESINLAKEFVKYSSTPVIIQPNAGMPKYRDGKTTYDIDENTFAVEMKKIALLGASILGGCCGTTPEHIHLLKKEISSLDFSPITKKDYTIVCSSSMAVVIEDEPVIIGERINPTGKKLFKEALKKEDYDYILNEAISQKDMGAHILDVNVGIPEIDETLVMTKAIKEIQTVVNSPLQIDSSNKDTILEALKIYNGKAVINSVNGKKITMEEIFPIVRKYGGVVVGLTLDEDGIPPKAEDRYKIAKRIVENAAKYGIEKKDILIDCLVLTASAQQEEVLETIKAVKMVREKLGVKTVLGVSNVSFGLPQRQTINSVFLSMALLSGLNCCIVNPSSSAIMNTIYAFNVLTAKDKGAAKYIANISQTEVQTDPNIKKNLKTLIINGLKEEAAEFALNLAKDNISPVDIVENHVIPALDEVGRQYDKGIMFLPQLIQSAESAKAVFAATKRFLTKKDNSNKGTIVIATVLGDVHDIGKNIVKLLLQNYGFEVIDLGKNVPIETIVDEVKNKNIKLLGLSALMTTTVENMEKTIKEVNKICPNCKIMVGGAVLTKEYAESINADFYCPDALSGVEVAMKVFE